MKKTENELTQSDESILGDIYIGAGESDGNRLLAQIVSELNQTYPDIHLHISSGNSNFVTEQLDKGLIDFGLIYGPVDYSKYEVLNLPFSDTFGVLMRSDSELAKKEFITADDLIDKPLIISAQEQVENHPSLLWITSDISKLNVVATYTLIFNGSLMVEEGLGYAICFDKLINTNGTNLCFRPLNPSATITAHIIYKKYQIFSKPAQKFLEKLQELQ